MTRVVTFTVPGEGINPAMLAGTPVLAGGSGARRVGYITDAMLKSDGRIEVKAKVSGVVAGELGLLP
jgi:hypothetical protein